MHAQTLPRTASRTPPATRRRCPRRPRACRSAGWPCTCGRRRAPSARGGCMRRGQSGALHAGRARSSPRSSRRARCRRRRARARCCIRRQTRRRARRAAGATSRASGRRKRRRSRRASARRRRRARSQRGRAGAAAPAGLEGESAAAAAAACVDEGRRASRGACVLHAPQQQHRDRRRRPRVHLSKLAVHTQHADRRIASCSHLLLLESAPVAAASALGTATFFFSTSDLDQPVLPRASNRFTTLAIASEIYTAGSSPQCMIEYR